MSFILHPGVLTTEGLPPYNGTPISGWDDPAYKRRFFIGTGKDEGLFLFMRNGKWTIAADIMPDIRIIQKNITLKPNCRLRYGLYSDVCCTWEYTHYHDTSWYLFFRSNTNWILRNEPPGTEPVLNPNESFYTATQDYWLGSGNIHEAPVVFYNVNDSSKKLTLQPSFPRWEYNGTSELHILPAGTFQPVDGARGIRTVGTPVKDESGRLIGYVIDEKKKNVYMGEIAICR